MLAGTSNSHGSHLLFLLLLRRRGGDHGRLAPGFGLSMHFPDEDDSVAEKEEEVEDEGEIAVVKKSNGKSGSDGSP